MSGIPYAGLKGGSPTCTLAVTLEVPPRWPTGSAHLETPGRACSGRFSYMFARSEIGFVQLGIWQTVGINDSKRKLLQYDIQSRGVGLFLKP